MKKGSSNLGSSARLEQVCLSAQGLGRVEPSIRAHGVSSAPSRVPLYTVGLTSELRSVSHTISLQKVWKL